MQGVDLRVRAGTGLRELQREGFAADAQPAGGAVDAQQHEALDNADLNGFLEAAIRALPDSVIDAAVKTDDVLVRTIEDLDLRTVLEDLDNEQDLYRQIDAAVAQAVKDSLVARLRDLL